MKSQVWRPRNLVLRSLVFATTLQNEILETHACGCVFKNNEQRKLGGGRWVGNLGCQGMRVRVGGTLWQREEVSENELAGIKWHLSLLLCPCLDPKFCGNRVYHSSPSPEA